MPAAAPHPPPPQPAPWPRPARAGERRLGELLVARGLVDGRMLDEALRTQVIFGGRVGTTLVELEHLSIDALAAALAAQHGVPEAPRSALAAPDPAALRGVPGEICQAYEVFPMAAEGRLLHLAACDPHDLHRMDEVAFRLGVRVRAYALPELRLHYLLERHYGIQRKTRYLRLPPDDAPAPESDRRHYLAPTETPPPPPEDPEFDLVYLDERPGPEEDFELVVELPEAPPSMDALRAAASPADLTAALLSCGLGSARALFAVRGRLAAGVAARGAPGADRIGELVLSLEPRSTLRDAWERRAVVMAGGEDPFQALVASYLGAPPPEATCVLPIVAGGEVAQLLCLQAPVAFDPGAAAAARDLAREAAAAYERLVATLASA